MNLTATQSATTNKPVGMGQIVSSQESARMTAVLGSCVGVAIYHPRLHIGAFAHIVLPSSGGKSGSPGKFADTAIASMMKDLRNSGANAGGLCVKMAGGASLFKTSGPINIGEENIKATAKEIEKYGLRVAGKDLGGTKGRRVVFDCFTGDYTIEIISNAPIVI